MYKNVFQINELGTSSTGTLENEYNGGLLNGGDTTYSGSFFFNDNGLIAGMNASNIRFGNQGVAHSVNIAGTTGNIDTSGHLTVDQGLGVGTAGTTTVGLIRATNDVVAFYSSDKRLKDNLIKIGNPLDKISQLNGYEFDWIAKKGIHENEGHDIGVIAQEVEKVIPEIVQTRDNGYKAVKYEKIVPLLIESIKELKQRVEELENGSS